MTGGPHISIKGSSSGEGIIEETISLLMNPTVPVHPSSGLSIVNKTFSLMLSDLERASNSSLSKISDEDLLPKIKKNSVTSL